MESNRSANPILFTTVPCTLTIIFDNMMMNIGTSILFHDAFPEFFLERKRDLFHFERMFAMNVHNSRILPALASNSFF
jgi:hypothetical protein